MKIRLIIHCRPFVKSIFTFNWLTVNFPHICLQLVLNGGQIGQLKCLIPCLFVALFLLAIQQLRSLPAAIWAPITTLLLDWFLHFPQLLTSLALSPLQVRPQLLQSFCHVLLALRLGIDSTVRWLISLAPSNSSCSSARWRSRYLDGSMFIHCQINYWIWYQWRNNENYQ